MLEDTNSLDGAHLLSISNFIIFIFLNMLVFQLIKFLLKDSFRLLSDLLLSCLSYDTIHFAPGLLVLFVFLEKWFFFFFYHKDVCCFCTWNDKRKGFLIVLCQLNLLKFKLSIQNLIRFFHLWTWFILHKSSAHIWIVLSYKSIKVKKTDTIWAAPWENLFSGVSDQVRLKLACSATEARMRLDILVTETRDITLSR